MFKNREEAALLLSEKLIKYKNKNGIILAVPRGGVPLGHVVARQLNLPLEIILSKKIGHPLNPEFAIGSVSLNGSVMSEHNSNIDKEYFEREARRIRSELKNKYRIFMGQHVPAKLNGKIVIIVDDGIATGNTIAITIDTIRKDHPEKIVVAVPVAPPDTADRLRDQADEFICLYEPEGFCSIGQYYYDFSQVTDEEVIQLLNYSEK